MPTPVFTPEPKNIESLNLYKMDNNNTNDAGTQGNGFTDKAEEPIGKEKTFVLVQYFQFDKVIKPAVWFLRR